MNGFCMNAARQTPDALPDPSKAFLSEDGGSEP